MQNDTFETVVTLLPCLTMDSIRQLLCNHLQYWCQQHLNLKRNRSTSGKGMNVISTKETTSIERIRKLFRFSVDARKYQ